MQHCISFRRRLSVDQFDYGALCSVLAARTAGMSGRALSKLGVAWQAAAYASDDGRLTQQMCIEICDDAVHDHRQKVCIVAAKRAQHPNSALWASSYVIKSNILLDWISFFVIAN